MAIQNTRILNRKKIYRSTETWVESFRRQYLEKDTAFIIGIACTGLAYVSPEFGDFFISAALFFLFSTIYLHSDKVFRLPMRMPKYAAKFGFKKDRGDPIPGSKTKNGGYTSFFPPQGICFMGKDENGTELWVKEKDLCTHVLVFGTTGAGKTVALQAICWNMLSMGSAFVYIDPKAGPNLQFEFGLMCRRMGIDDNFRLLNFLLDQGKNESKVEITDDPVSPTKKSNTLNALANGSSADIVTMFSSLLGKAEGSNAVFQEKAVALLQALTPMLVSLRDAKQIDFSMSTFRKYLDPEPIVGLVYGLYVAQWQAKEASVKIKEDTAIKDRNQDLMMKGNPPMNSYEEKKARKRIRNDIIDNMIVVEQTDQNLKEEDKVPDCMRYRRFFTEEQVSILRSFLKSVNFVENKDLKAQEQTFFDQYTYARSYFVKALTLMSGSYAHIFNAPSGEIDLQDVLLNNRVFICMLPSMQKSEEETATLGKIILSQIKNSIAIALGNKVEGASDEVLDKLVSKSRVPMCIVVDEYAAIATPGFAVVLTQARSLGFSAIIGTQDYKGLKKADEGEAGQIVANTNIKFFMLLKDSQDTWKLFQDSVDKEKVEEVNLDTPGERGRIVDMDIVDFKDLSSQIEGEYFCLFRERPIVGQFPLYVPPTGGQIQRLVRLVDSSLPQQHILDEIVAMQERNADKIGAIRRFKRPKKTEAAA